MKIYKIAGGIGRFSEDLSDVLEAQVHINKDKSIREILDIIKSDSGIVDMMRDEEMSDIELIDVIDDTLKFERRLTNLR